MTKFGFAAVAAIAALLGILGFSGSAQAYPDIQQSLTVDQQVVYGGDSFTATASANVDCAWDLEWNGQERTGSGAGFSATYVAPQVTAVEEIALVGTCQYAAPVTGVSRATAATWRDSVTITVRPGASGAASPIDGAGADLPGTGGPDRVFLVSGLALLLSGATAVTVARRRAEESDLPVQTA